MRSAAKEDIVALGPASENSLEKVKSLGQMIALDLLFYLSHNHLSEPLHILGPVKNGKEQASVVDSGRTVGGHLYQVINGCLWQGFFL